MKPYVTTLRALAAILGRQIWRHLDGYSSAYHSYRTLYLAYLADHFGGVNFSDSLDYFKDL